jgi:hypothetical protein
MERSRIDRLSSVFLGAPLPKNLKKFVERSGFDRALFGDEGAWHLHSRAYLTLKQMSPTPGFYEIGSVLLAYLEAKAGPFPILSRKQASATRRQKKSAKKRNIDQWATQKLASDLKRAKPTTRDRVSDWRSAPKIGLGLESKLSQPPRARREDVIIDTHTAPTGRLDSYHAIYVAGWSMAPEDD